MGPQKTRAQIRLAALQRMGIGITTSGAEDTSNRVVPLATMNDQVNAAIQRVQSDIEDLSPVRLLRRATVLYPSDTQYVTLLSLGIEGKRLDSVFYIDKTTGLHVYELQRAPESEMVTQFNSGIVGAPLIITSSQSTSVWPGTGLFRWWYGPGDRFGILPRPGESERFEIRYYGDGFIRLDSDQDPVPEELVYHRAIQDMIEYALCARVDPELGRRAFWENEYQRVRYEGAKVFAPEKPREWCIDGAV